ncbi:MAG: hypothetical protein MRZ32_02065 [Bacteroidales bacterium]|nr:hypothetical protein [Bacteroidales bacterium]MDY2916242.1 CpsB/CapC family capsule biosynthesis tyrosine phosphatase [Muribaculaceae bacterium]
MFSIFNKHREPIKLWFSTDIHAHILPGIDDGSPDPETSLQLLEGMRDLGITKVIASPHITENTFENNAETIDAAQAALDSAMADAGMTGITVSHHAENRVDSLFMRNFKAGNLLTLPGKVLLIENSFVQEPWGLEQLIYDLQVAGYTPVMAHPERFHYYTPQRLRELHRKVDFQVNMLSLAGYYGKNIRKRAEEMMEMHLIDYLGTDTHNMTHVEAIRDYLGTKNAVKDREILAPLIKNSRFD